MRQRVIAMASPASQTVDRRRAGDALDVTIQAQIIELVKQLRDEFGMAIIWITHDLGVVAGIADTVQVMYAGRIVERGKCREVFGDTRHPYTLGLLRSLPRLDRSHQKLIQIEGAPPDLRIESKGCPFEPRCPFRLERCRTDPPVLEQTEDGQVGHTMACWVDVREGVAQSG
jgi:oligopeptide/dipeptide ABC transporter ATP-binding protein